MSREKCYTKRTLDNAVERYFKSITREKTVTDETGAPVVNRLGKTVTVTEYILPPTVADLCDALKITRATWSNYRKDPELGPIVEKAGERMRGWNERELLIRKGKDLKGIIFNLENNYGYREQHQMEVRGSVEDFLKQQEAGEGPERF